jgi:NAD(P)-dependent dehydrogenase (short-subunit alcohol dehydrogenase family)
MKTALVTGGAKRIGAAIVRDLAQNGFNVAVHAASSTDAAESLTELALEHGVKACFVSGDLTDAKSTKQVFVNAANTLGSIDLLVNNASIFENDSAESFDGQTWDKHFAIHLKAPAILASEMIKQQLSSGLIVNMIDQRVNRLNPNFFSYTLSKSALWTATQTMAQSFAPRIRVNAIGPGPTLANERQTQEDFEKQVKAIPMQQAPTLESFGRTVRYLYETPSITGQMIALDGGQHLAWETPDVVGIVE